MGGCGSFAEYAILFRWDLKKNLFSHLSVMTPELGYLAKMDLLHHLVDLHNYNNLPPSVIPFWKALVQANKI